MRGLLIAIAIIIVAIIGIAIWNSSRNSSANQQANNPTNTGSNQNSSGYSNQGSSMKVTLSEVNNSRESGTATITDENGMTLVVLEMSGATSSVPQPAHFHVGTCPGVGAVAIPLNSIIGGRSSTTINLSYDQLIAKLPLAINVHKSAAQINTYVSCGVAQRPQ